MIAIKHIDFTSLCEHHLLPFSGRVGIGYIPNGRILGLSKFSRLVDIFAKRLQVQERLTNQIKGAVNDLLKPLGTFVIIEAK